MKRKIMMLLMVFVLIINTQWSIRADDAENEISLRYTHISSISAGLSIDSSNVANCLGTVTIRDNYKSRMYVSLYKSSSSGSYSRIKMWAQDFTGTGMKIMNKYYTVTRGYKYKVKVEVRIYNSAGNVIETAEKYSVTVDNT
ncbi:MAG: hypothetical protein K6G85_00105 [Eubacterium sp.]|nr:hypothetical protein [Eubacterium sp.]